MEYSKEKWREIQFQLLYTYEWGSAEEEGSIDLLMRHLKVTRKTMRQVQQEIAAWWPSKEKVDSLLEKASIGYEWTRVPSVEKAILRLAAFEILHEVVPPKVAIVEALRLARKFATKEGSTFINGVLDAFYHQTAHP